jgi:hypothetical protein
MPSKKSAPAPAVRKGLVPTHPPTPLSLPAEAALSFLRDTKGTVTWSNRDLADTLKITRADADRVVALLQAQGYVQPGHANGEWVTTPSGETVSGAKTPRFDRLSVKEALTALQGRIKQSNTNPKTPFEIADAVAFGDFLLTGRVRVQAADVGIRLVRREARDSSVQSASDAREERAFLRQLRGRTALLTLGPYADWMKQRTHLDLL